MQQTQEGQERQWGPKSAGIAGCAAAGLIIAILSATLGTDVAGRVLTGAAGLGLIVFAGVSWRARPKLAIDDDGLVVRGWRGVQLLRRADIATVRITEFQRIGRKVRLLEIETADDRLRVLSRWDLGADPVQVFDVLTRAGYGAG